MIVSQIVAMSENRVIGKNGALPWRIPADLKFFKEKTTGHAIVMGRRTFESIGRALPNRLNIVVTRSVDFSAPGIVVAPSIEAALKIAVERSTEWGDEVFVIGGGEIYKQSLACADRIYLTKVRATIEGDTYFPEFDEGAYRAQKLLDGSDPVPFEMFLLEKQ